MADAKGTQSDAFRAITAAIHGPTLCLAWGAARLRGSNQPHGQRGASRRWLGEGKEGVSTGT
jgi:hypothetical protein